MRFKKDNLFTIFSSFNDSITFDNSDYLQVAKLVTSIHLQIFNNIKIQTVHEYLPITSTWKEHSALFPLPSTASHVTFVRPMLKLVPDCRLHETWGEIWELSDALACFHSTTAVGLAFSVWNDLSSSHTMLGASLSTIAKTDVNQIEQPS